MGTKFAIIIGLEKYHSKDIRAVAYAEADADEFSSTLEKHGFNLSNQTILNSAGATKNIIESGMRRVFSQLGEKDVLYLF